MADEPELILVGVVHGDPGGYRKLLALLEQIRPQFISVEISPYSCQYRRRHQKRWQEQFRKGLKTLPASLRQHGALRRVAAQIAWPFEVRAAAAYARREGLGWRAVDLSRLAREHLPLFGRELLNPENLVHLSLTADADWEAHITQEYRRARRALQTGSGGALGYLGQTGTPLERLREKVLAQRVARLARQWGRVVHVGGWEHLRLGGSRKTMADFLITFNPQIVLLDGMPTSGAGNRVSVSQHWANDKRITV